MTTEDKPAPSVLKAARAYVKDGFKVIPVPKRKKAPRIKGWQKLDLSQHDLAEYFGKRNNVGVLLGGKAGWLVDVDLDASEAVAAADAFLPKTGWIHGRPGNPRSHRFYRSKGAKTLRFNDQQGECLVELRSTGHQTLVPPSMHPSGDRYTWDQAGKPGRVAASELTHGVARVAACTLVARKWPKKGDRQRCALALAGMLLRAGWSVKEVAHFIGTTARIAGDDEFKKRGRVAQDTHKKLKKRTAATGRLKLQKILGSKVVNLVAEWLRIKTNAKKGKPSQSSKNSAFTLKPIRLVKMDPPEDHIVEVRAGMPGEERTFHVTPATVRDARQLARVIANRTGEMLDNGDPRLLKLRAQIRRIPRIRGVSELGWTPGADTFVYGSRALKTKGDQEKLVFIPKENR